MAGRDRSPSDGPTVVVHLITTLTQGGAERVLSQVVPRPDEAPGQRHIVVSLVDGGMFADELRQAGVEVRGLGMRPGRDVVRGMLRLAGVLRELEPSLVASWMYHACLLDLLARPFAGRARTARMVWFLQGSLHSLHGLPLHTRLTVRLLGRLSSRPETVAINSRTGRRHHTKAGYRPRRWTLLPNGCDTERFRPDLPDRVRVRKELGISSHAIVAVCVARVHAQKDHATLIDALRRVHAEHPRLELILIGTGTKTLAADTTSGLRIRGLGERRDVAQLMRSADLVVSSSLTEGLPNALLEGMATGLVPVVTDVGDCRAVVGSTGRVVPPGDAAALAAAVTSLLASGDEERARLGRAARHRVIDAYDAGLARREYRALWDADVAESLRLAPRDPGPLHVVHVIARMNVGGPARILAGLLSDISNDRLQQTLVTGMVGDGEEDWFVVRDPGMVADDRIIRLEGFGRAIAPLRDLRTRRALTRLLDDLQPDVVQTHTAKAGQLGRRAALRAGTPHLIHTFHGHTLHGYFPRPLSALFTWLERRLARRTDDLVAVGSRVRDELLAAGIGTVDQYTVLPPGVADEGVLDRDVARSEIDLPEHDRAVVAFIGRLSGVKRPDRFLEAAELVAARHPETIFLVVGDGDQRLRLESLPLSADVRFLGWRGDIARIHAAADLIVVTSDNEGMPVTLIEAAMAGRACVTTDVGSAGEVVLDGTTGRVVARDPRAVADAIVELLDDSDRRRRLGTAARQHALAEFSQTVVTERLLNLYRRGPRRSRG